MTTEQEATQKLMAQQARQNAVMLASQGLRETGTKATAKAIVKEAAIIEAFILTGIVPDDK